MYYLRTPTLILLMLSFISIGNAQKHKGNFTLLFKSGERILPTNLKSTNVLDYDRSEIVDDRFYRMIQFEEIPSEEEKQSIYKSGIRLLDYIPHKAYFASIPANIQKEDLSDFNIRSIQKIKATYKLDSNLDLLFSSNNITTNITIQFHQDIKTSFISAFSNSLHFDLLEKNTNNKTIAIRISSEKINRIATLPFIKYISEADQIPQAEDNVGQSVNRSNIISNNPFDNWFFNGDGIHVAIGDDGTVGPHIDFKGRTEQSEVARDIDGDHGDMVAGVLGGAGNLNPQIQGIASNAFIHILDGFDAVTNSSYLYENENVTITSTSYGDGCNRGYTTFANFADKQTRLHHSLIHVFSVGNLGEEDCDYGAGEGWGNVTGGVKVGKNVIAVANVFDNDLIVPNSSRGPASDGRIKPDISALGNGQSSTAPNNNFQAATGSSAAAPGVAGVLALLYEAYQTFNNGDLPPSALMKACILNTADDLGNLGPDFTYGWGRINSLKALQLLEQDYYFADSIVQNENKNFDIDIPEGVEQVKIMLYWHDFEGSPVSSKSLVNDLDMTVFDPDSNQHYPWVLNSSPDPDLLNLPANIGIDNINNVEQIFIEHPASGNYSIAINGSEIPQGPQKFYIVYQFIKDEIKVIHPFGGEKLVPNEIEKIYWDAFDEEDDFQIQYSLNKGETWIPLSTVEGHLRSFDWTIPNLTNAEIKIKISRNGIVGESGGSFNIMPLPQNFEVTKVCPLYTRLSWDPVENANAYILYKLGNQYMDSIATVQENEIDIPTLNPNEINWFAVSALGDNGLCSRRSIAINNGDILIDCNQDHDLSLLGISSPITNAFYDCFETALPISINIHNAGSESQSNFPIYYQLEEETIITEIYSGSIPPNITVNYIFNTPLNVSVAGNYSLKTWTGLSVDEASFNDTLVATVNVIAGTTESIPYFQNFDEFEIPNFSNKCKKDYLLQNGWTNDYNNIGDDIDWKANTGETPTYGTGPHEDQNSKSGDGNYLFIEASKGCFEKEAILLSPCFDLSDINVPVFNFWYYMKGENLGSLHIDLFDGTQWYNNITTPLIGDQGDMWQQVNIDLTTFANTLVNIRFRATTGDGYLTDIAIDNVAFLDAHSPPFSGFSVDKKTTCTGEAIYFSDNSFNHPTNWEWSFSTDQITFLDGTTPQSPNPIVVFNEVGNFDVSLISSNEYGTDEVLIFEDYIHISNGKNLPTGENFELNLNIPEQWNINNPDDATTWAITKVNGKDGFVSNTLYINNHSYNAPNQEDDFVSYTIDLTEATQPFLRFDIAYTQYSQSFSDALRVDLSNNCGNSFDHTVYYKYGPELITTSSQTQAFAPSTEEDWRTEIIDLSEFIGTSIVLKFVNINGFGNNLYLDDILVYEYPTFPHAQFQMTPSSLQTCVGESITFENTSSGNNIETYEWNFGEYASPPTANTFGPHTVMFNEVGLHKISLKASNNLGFDKSNINLQVLDVPTADFEISQNNQTVSLTNLSTFGSTYLWDFGDQTTSTQTNISHHYENSNTYTISLTVMNICGSQTIQKEVTVTTSVKNINADFDINIHPNPVFDFINIEVESPDFSTVLIDLFDSKAQLIITQNIQKPFKKISKKIAVEDLSQGVYFIRIQMLGKAIVKKLVIYKE